MDRLARHFEGLNQEIKKKILGKDISRLASGGRLIKVFPGNLAAGLIPHRAALHYTELYKVLPVAELHTVITGRTREQGCTEAWFCTLYKGPAHVRPQKWLFPWVTWIPVVPHAHTSLPYTGSRSVRAFWPSHPCVQHTDKAHKPRYVVASVSNFHL